MGSVRRSKPRHAWAQSNEQVVEDVLNGKRQQALRLRAVRLCSRYGRVVDEVVDGDLLGVGDGVAEEVVEDVASFGKCKRR